MEISKKELKHNAVKLKNRGHNGRLYLMDGMVLKKFKSDVGLYNRECSIDLLLKYPIILNSGYPKDKLFIDGEFCGYVCQYFDNSCSFNSKKAWKLSFIRKKRAIYDVNKQMKQLHDRMILYNDVNSDNLLINEDGGHIVDFEDVYFKGIKCPLVKYLIFNGNTLIYKSKKSDQLKLLVSILSLLYEIDIEKYFYKDISIDYLLKFVKYDSILFDYISSCFYEFDKKNVLPYFNEVLGDLNEDMIEYNRKKIKGLFKFRR